MICLPYLSDNFSSKIEGEIRENRFSICCKVYYKQAMGILPQMINAGRFPQFDTSSVILTTIV